MIYNSLIDQENSFDSYFVAGDGIPQGFSDDQWFLEQSSNPYRLYRFLTDLEDIITNETQESIIVRKLIPKVRRLLTESEWIQMEYTVPDPQVGWSVNTIYDEPDFPLTVQMVTWLPGEVTPIHNHATWGIVAIIAGTEKNTFW